MSKFVVLLRIKDGMFFLPEWLECFEKIADDIVVVDNGSTDGTFEMLKRHPKVVDIIQTEGYNEGRDKNLLYDLARKRNPDWCLWIDVDEIMEPQVTRKHLDKLMSNRLVNKYAFRRFHFIDREHFAGSNFRLHYSAGHDRVMWRESPKGYFENVVLDSPNVKGITGLQLNTNYRLKHLGYINKELVDKKADIYRQITRDKEQTLQEMYMRNERPIKWIDDIKSLEVRKLNCYLSYLRFTTLVPRIFKKFMRMAKNATGNATSNFKPGTYTSKITGK